MVSHHGWFMVPSLFSFPPFLCSGGIEQGWFQRWRIPSPVTNRSLDARPGQAFSHVPGAQRPGLSQEKPCRRAGTGASGHSCHKRSPHARWREQPQLMGLFAHTLFGDNAFFSPEFPEVLQQSPNGLFFCREAAQPGEGWLPVPAPSRAGVSFQMSARICPGPSRNAVGVTANPTAEALQQLLGCKSRAQPFVQ